MNEHLDARYFGDHPEFRYGEYVTLQITPEHEWFVFDSYGIGHEVEPIDVHILED